MNLPAGAAAQTDEFATFLERYREEHHIPAISAAIVRDGEVAWAEAFGWSDDEGEVPADAGTTFWIASVTKPIAATAILAEAEAGRLDLATPLRADSGFDDTCEWLRGSGILFGSGGTEPGGYAIGPVDCTSPLTIADALDMRVNEGTGEHAFVYNPIVYARLDRAIRGAGGRDLREMLRSNVLRPAGMSDVALGWRDPEGGAALRLLAPPFAVDAEGRLTRRPMPDDDLRAAAGIWASPTQVALFDIAFDDGRLISGALHETIVAVPPARAYAHGWFHEEWRGHKLMWHSGWEENSYSALYLKLPDRRLSLIVMANTEGIWWDNPLSRAEVSKSAIAREFLELFVGE